jgi:hypothetical protein
MPDDFKGTVSRKNITNLTVCLTFLKIYYGRKMLNFEKNHENVLISIKFGPK